ncbi:protein translocase subunit SecF [Pseudogemmobacter faecipullorum]|uniref:Protein-export membrane protein SecF n=1 Tax=Pseudogemmobacter faecipullorum TaxID=2755041 RepID=A0ABS8CKQ4_9RHOB|nr:protein translocase subunit SecF [Pseudogemmobacter faecipullorum]MCB5409974.1 protein translocase subunit SecF [Pseudogemmobacter faecipullorum]
MAFRLKLVPEKTNFDFFRWQSLTFGLSMTMIFASILCVSVMGLNLGVDFKGGTTIRTESTSQVEVGAMRDALGALDLGDVTITEVNDPAFREDQHVAQVRVGAREGEEAVTPEMILEIEEALRAIDPAMTFPSVESVGPKVSNELIRNAIIAIFAGAAGILVYVWMRFEWQMAVGCVAALLHDVIVTVGIFSLFQLKFDLAIVAALLTILGYSVNDTVVIFDRLRENLAKYKTMPLREMMNLTTNETLSRTVMTATTTFLALLVLLIFGGDVIRGFVFAMLLGVILGTWSTLYMAKNIVLYLGLDRSDKTKKAAPSEFADIDA